VLRRLRGRSVAEGGGAEAGPLQRRGTLASEETWQMASEAAGLTVCPPCRWVMPLSTPGLTFST